MVDISVTRPDVVALLTILNPFSDLTGPLKVVLAIIFSSEKISPIVLACLLGQSIGKFTLVNKLEFNITSKWNKDKEKFKPLIKRIKSVLKDRVKDVNISNRLMDSPSCIVIDQNDPSIQMQEIMKKMGNINSMPEVKPILEINPGHKIISKMN